MRRVGVGCGGMLRQARCASTGGRRHMTVLPDFLEDAVDLHVHSAPDVDVRRFNDIELAQEAARAGMSAILIKSHQNSTVERAWLVSQWIPGIRVFGGIVLNETVGGLNPAAVRLAVKMG